MVGCSVWPRLRLATAVLSLVSCQRDKSDKSRRLGTMGRERETAGFRLLQNGGGGQKGRRSRTSCYQDAPFSLFHLLRASTGGNFSSHILIPQKRGTSSMREALRDCPPRVCAQSRARTLLALSSLAHKLAFFLSSLLGFSAPQLLSSSALLLESRRQMI